MKISHEVPICLLQESRNFNDYDYALVHLFEEQPKYLQFYKDSVEQGREVILDNSIFELGESFSIDRFAHWVREVKPTYYIIPDTLENYKSTIEKATRWFAEYSDLPGKSIGVLQGSTLEEIVNCYTELHNLGVDKIAISFDYSLYSELYPHKNKLVSWCFGRILLINKLIELDIIDTNLPHHLLGCSLPQEFSYYKEEVYKFIESLDTSNPITFALSNKLYSDLGVVHEKPQKKLFELIEHQMTTDQYKLVVDNVKFFRKIVNI